MNELDHLHVRLGGRNLIEASAGTGKTYAIACLYLRLVIEQNLQPEQILVVTYTEAATEELRDRIRSRIREALEVFDGAGTKDAFLQGLQANINGKGPGSGAARDRLDLALKSFDLASIFTIHGFCLRALQDNAFESGSLYDTELVTDQADLLQEVVDDFWRRHFFAESAPLLGYALRHKLTPEYFVAFLKGMLGNPKVRILPDMDLTRLPALENECRQAFAAVRQMWQEHKAEVMTLLRTDKGLSRSKDVFHLDVLPLLFESMDAFVAGDNPYDLFIGFGKLCRSGILAAKKPTGAPLAHPFFDQCEVLRHHVEQRFLALRSELIAFARERMPARKLERNIRFFDDLLTNLHDALYGPRGGALAATLGQKYRAALIDEFQDTDPVQYDIFRKIYSDPGAPLFLIGDPKQAIYSFRGADIFAYLEAAADVDDGQRFTLTGNWRSTPRLLDAFNTLFRNDRKPFVFDSIGSLPVKSGREEAGEPLTLAHGDNAPLQLWYVPADGEGKDSNVGRANTVVPGSVAAEIARLLHDGQQGRALIHGRHVLPEDIAVIVRSHRQAGYIQDALQRLGIPSVMRSDRSIFTTDEAREVCTLLGALADPGSEPKIRAALVTGILGLTGDDIAHLQENEQLWEEWLGKFRDYHQAWQEKGFMVMVQAFLSMEGVRGRLLRRPDGERCLTNLLHCFEILHAACHGRRLGTEGLATWFGERISGEDRADEYQIRLETDEKAVKILTIHVSKGLEYPIVFCPFLWGGTMTDDGVLTFHEGFDLVKDFGSPDMDGHKIIARKEALAENLRLLYVALTRAKFRCYLVAGKIVDRTGRNRPETSSLAYLFHASATTRASGDPVGSLAREIKNLSAAAVVEQLEGLAAEGQGAIAVSPLPDPEGTPPYAPLRHDGTRPVCRQFSGTIDRNWRVSSFTSFAAHDVAPGELPDRDESGGNVEVSILADQEPQGLSFFNFPRGAHAGIFLHEIFEKYDYAELASDKNNALVVDSLKKHGFGDEWLPCIRTMIDNVLTTRLAAPDGPFVLSGLGPGRWLAELEFFFPLRFVTSAILRDCLDGWSGHHATVDLQAIGRALRFRPAEGMVRGFMDMVFEHNGRFYLVDWKSNHLGNRIEDYGREALKEAMVQKLYPLQYLLYTVALNTYLSLRVRGYDYTTHFGGVLYMFLRGVSRKRGEEFGIFRDTPPAAMIDELTECLIRTGG